MNKQKFSTTNRYGLKIVCDIWIPENSSGLDFVMQGLGGHKEEETVQTISKTIFNNGFIVINFDSTNSFGESEGEYKNATMQMHFEDLVEVIAWAKSQFWYKELFVLSGHSLEGYVVARYAEDYPEKVKTIFPHALVVSGDLSYQAGEISGEIKTWKETGWWISESKSKPSLIKRLPWLHMEERLKHNLLPNAGKITMPILFIIGEHDRYCPPEHQKILYKALMNYRERVSCCFGRSTYFSRTGALSRA